MSPSSSSSSSSSSSAPRCPVPSKAKNCRCACDAVSSSGVDRASGDPTVGLRGLPGPFGGFALRPDCQGEDPCGVSTIAEPYVCQQDDGDTVVVSLDAQTVYWFDRVDGEYVVRHEDPDSGPSLTHDQVNHYYILTLPDGSSFRFHDHDQATYDAGSFDRITAPGGRVTQATSHSGGTVAEVQTETTSGGSTYKTSTLRTFVDGGEHDGRLQTVTTRRQEDGGDWTDVRKMEYTYYADEAAGGNSGDVETVKVENHDGTQWTEVDRLYLRHYTDDQATGAAAGHVRFVLGRAAFEALADDPGVADPLAASDAQVAQYADQALLYDDDKRVSQQTVAAGTLQYAFDYSTNDVAPDGYNNWYHRTVETRPDGSEEIVYTNHVRQLLLRDLVDGDDHSYTYRQYDADGNLILEAGSAAVVSYNDNAQTTGMLEVTLATDEGKIVVFDYYDTTTTGGGGVGVSGLKQYDKIQQGSEGTPILLREYQYTQYTDGNGRTVYRPAGTIEYRNEDGTGGVETAYGYTWHSGTLAVEQLTTTLPAVSAAQNGSGVSAVRTERFDTDGRAVWARDERGYLTHHEYDPATGNRLVSIADVETDLVDDEPSGWTTPADGGMHLISNSSYDVQGRVIESLGPEHEVDGQTVRTASWTVHDDAQNEVRSARGFATPLAGSSSGSGDSYTYTLVNPVSISWQDPSGRASESITATLGSGVTREGKLTASDTFAQSSYVRWSTSAFNSAGQHTDSRQYHTIPVSGEGTEGTHYDQTRSGYDSAGRQNATTAPGGTITRTVFDVKGNPVETYVGTDDTGASDTDPTGGSSSGSAGNNMVLVTENEYYDGAVTGCGTQLTLSTQHVDDATTRVTSNEYDWRGRHTGVSGEEDLYQRTTFDNLDRPIRIETYDTNASGTLLSRGESSYDDLGRVYQSTTYAVDPDTGTVGNGLTGDTWYDAAGNVIKSQPAGAKTFTKMVYDSLGRAVTTYVGYSAGESSYEEAESLTCNAIVEQSETMFDEVGNVIFTSAYQRMHNATGMGELNGPSGEDPKARVSYTAAWHDALGRVTASASYGTNGDTAPTRPDSAPASSDTVLVGTTEYNAVGQAYKSIDPAGREDRQEHDSLGRLVKNTQNYTDGNPSTGGADEDVVVETTYSPDGQVATLVAKNSTTGDQTTTYVYGTTLEDSDIARADLLRAEILPDSDDTSNPLGSGQDTVYDRVEFAYNRLGQVIEKTDQNGTVHEFVVDGLGRRTSDRVTTVGTGIDDAVLRLSATFDKLGLPEKLSSYDGDTGGNVVNEVQLVHNDFGQLVTEYQEHEGVVNTSTTPTVAYTYPDGSAGHIRLQKMTYPNGRVLRFERNTGLDDAMNRVSFLADDDNGSVGTHLAAYSYLGAGTIACEDLCQPQVRLDRDHGVAGEYAGWDRFGRVVDHRWRDYGASADRDRYTHGYDRAGNRLYRENTTTSGKDEFYTYDGVDQLTAFDRGDLNVGKTAISGTPVREEDYSLDPTGNWTDYVQKTSGSTDLDQDRTHNKVNEITNVTETTGTAWITPAHDAAGNMTTIPKPSSLAAGLTCKYDAWNRLVVVTDDETVVAKYEYDGRGRRIKKHLDSQSPSSPNGIDKYSHYFYNGPQVVETRDTTTESDEPEDLQPIYQYVWSPRYIDAPILRDENTDGDDLCDDGRLFYLSDANYNVTALVDTTGAVVERYLYTPYGEVKVLNPDFTAGSSSYNNTTLYTGRELDVETGLYYYRARYYHAQLGRFINPDPILYDGGDMNLYAYVGASPVNTVDPSGLTGCECVVTSFKVTVNPPRYRGGVGTGFFGVRMNVKAEFSDEMPAMRSCCEYRQYIARHHATQMELVEGIPGNWHIHEEMGELVEDFDDDGLAYGYRSNPQVEGDRYTETGYESKDYPGFDGVPAMRNAVPGAFRDKAILRVEHYDRFLLKIIDVCNDGNIVASLVVDIRYDAIIDWSNLQKSRYLPETYYVRAAG